MGLGRFGNMYVPRDESGTGMASVRDFESGYGIELCVGSVSALRGILTGVSVVANGAGSVNRCWRGGAGEGHLDDFLEGTCRGERVLWGAVESPSESVRSSLLARPARYASGSMINSKSFGI